MSLSFSLKNKIVILRVHRIGHIPPARYASEVLQEAKLSQVILEFGNLYEPVKYIKGEVPKVRFCSPLAFFLPSKLRSTWIFFSSLLQIVFFIFIKGRPRLLVAHGLWEQTVAWIVNKTLGVSYVVHVHEVFDFGDVSFFNRQLLKLEKRILRGAKFCVFPEDTRLEVYRERYELGCPLYTVYNCPRKRAVTPYPQLKKQLGFKEDDFLMLYMGGISPANCIEEGIEALCYVSNLHFLIAGWGEVTYTTEILNKAKKLGVENRLHLLGVIDQKKWDYLQISDLAYCVYRPNELRRVHQATASNKLMESIASNTPVLVAGSPDFEEFLKRYPVGIALKNVEARAIAQAVTYLQQDEKRYQTLQENCQLAHESELNYEAQFVEVERAYKNFYHS